MLSQVARHGSSNKKHPRDCKGKLRQVERRKYKRKIQARYHKEMKKKFEYLTAQNNYLIETVEKFIGLYLRIHATEIQTSQNFHPNVGVKDEEGLDSNLVGTADEELDGLELDELLGELLPIEVAS